MGQRQQSLKTGVNCYAVKSTEELLKRDPTNKSLIEKHEEYKEAFDTDYSNSYYVD